jgi:CheY-like chemotaxis protein
MVKSGKSKILLVEDDTIISMELKYRLESMGYEIVGIVNSGEEAVLEATEKNPDLVLMDIELKGNMDGIEAADRIHSLLNIPVVYLTAYGDDTTYNRAQSTYPAGYLIKPLEENELQETIEVSLNRSRTGPE